MATSFDINTEIKNIMSSKMTMADKNAALIKIGLRPRDIQLLGFKKQMARRSTRLQIGSYTFGVEIECFNAPRYELVDAVMNKGVQIASECYNHDTKPHYKLVTDGSISGGNSVECVSPVIRNKSQENELKLVCEALNELGASVNRSCGLHVHIGASDFSDKHYINIFKNYQICEDVIDTFMANSRRADNAYYCQSIKRYNYDNCRTKSDVYFMMSGRYFKVNPASYQVHKTVEFRQHQGTTNYKKIIMWVQFLKELVDYSKHSVITTAPQTIDDLPFASVEVKEFFKARANELN